MAASVLEATCERIAEQHRSISEQHARWVDETAGAIVNSLKEENEALRTELAGLRDFIVAANSGRRRPAVPQLPKELAVGRATPLAIADDAAPIVRRPSLELTVASQKGRGPRGPAAVVVDDELREPEPPPRPILKVEPPSGQDLPKRLSFKRWLSEEENHGLSLPGIVSASWAKAADPTRPPPRATIARLVSGELEAKFESRERRRLRRMFRLRDMDDIVSFDHIAEVLGRRLGSHSLTGEHVAELLQEAEEVRESIAAKQHRELAEAWLVPHGCTLDGLMHLISPEAEALLQELRPGRDFLDIVRALQITTADELVEEAAKGIVKIAQPENVGGTQRIKHTIERYMNALVVVVVVVNVCALGISFDHSPEHLGWLVMEAFCVVVFVAEAFVKIYVHKASGYFCGKARYWNMIDACITVLSVLDLAISILAVGQTGANDTMVGKLARPVVIIRTLRVVRVIRLAKLLHSPLLRDFANMLVGFVIGAPALLWVLCLFVAVLYILGLVFRLMLGPAEGQDFMFAGGCGYGDDILNWDDERCKLHYLYGEEFFGTVSKSMFTAFRFMLGDYSTRGGKSMIVAFSYGYGGFFETVFVGWMIIVIFGLFNIITAIFVDTTTSGLKHNDVMRKYEQQYEREFVKSKLRRMVERVQEIRAEWESDPRFIEDVEDLRSFRLGEEEFVAVLLDPEVQQLMIDLDVSIFNPAGMFDTFDVDSDGHVTMLEFVQVFMKLRGDPQKTDIIGCVVSIRNLQDKVDQLALAVKHLSPQRAITRRANTIGVGTRTASLC